MSGPSAPTDICDIKEFYRQNTRVCTTSFVAILGWHNFCIMTLYTISDIPNYGTKEVMLAVFCCSREPNTSQWYQRLLGIEAEFVTKLDILKELGDDDVGIFI